MRRQTELHAASLLAGLDLDFSAHARFDRSGIELVSVCENAISRDKIWALERCELTASLRQIDCPSAESELVL